MIIIAIANYVMILCSSIVGLALFGVRPDIEKMKDAENQSAFMKIFYIIYSHLFSIGMITIVLYVFFYIISLFIS